MSEKKVAIYLCGAPGSGKSALAKRFAEESKSIFGNDLSIVDKYTERVENTGYPVGGQGAYVSNLVIYSEHRHAEDKLRSDKKNFITCGGMIERMAHSGIRVEILNGGLKTPESDMLAIREMHVATTFSFLLADTFAYSYVFYLPRRPGIAIGKEEHKDTFYQRIDMAIQTVIHKFNIPAIPVAGTVDEQSAIMMQVIKEGMEKAKLAEAAEKGTADGETSTA